jgi:hypothetical protein
MNHGLFPEIYTKIKLTGTGEHVVGIMESGYLSKGQQRQEIRFLA